LLVAVAVEETVVQQALLVLVVAVLVDIVHPF
jgi:hypothetical protein